jgi:hypothetical protein
MKAYTIGQEELYDKLVEKQRGHKSIGGSVWRTKQEALNFLHRCRGLVFTPQRVNLKPYPPEYYLRISRGSYILTVGLPRRAAVYEVELPTDWEIAVIDGETFGTLRVMAKIIKKITR